MKLTYEQKEKHESALDILNKEELTMEEKIHVYKNYIPGYNGGLIMETGTFFTPYNLARDFCLSIGGKRVIDLCAGIGSLSFQYLINSKHKCDITCIEINPEFVEIGKKLLPEANWIRGDVLDKEFITSLGTYDYVYSNPPFGNVITGNQDKWLKYKNSEFEFKVIEIASMLADSGAFIIPQYSCPFSYSGNQAIYKERNSTKYNAFHKHTGIQLDPSYGINTDIYREQWIGASPITEIVTFERIDV